MSSILRIDSSIRTEGSVSRAVIDTLVDTIVAEHDGIEVVTRDLGAKPVPSDVWSTSALAGFTPEDQWTSEQRSARALAASLADDVVDADVLVVGAPLYNYGVSQHLKAWIDVLLTDPRLGPGSETIQGKPAFLVVSRGGGYGEGTPREGWDHGTTWLRRILADVWGLDLEVIETELTLAEVTPQMAELRDLAREQLAAAHDAARTGGTTVTRKLSPVA